MKLKLCLEIWYIAAISPNSQGCSNTTVSPQCMMSMTPPLHRSPAVNQQHIVQSPQQHQPVQSPLSSGQNNALNQRSTIQSLPCQQSSNQHHSSSTLDHLDAATLPHAKAGFATSIPTATLRTAATVSGASSANVQPLDANTRTATEFAAASSACPTPTNANESATVRMCSKFLE
ncbi:hypothetical protein DICVIV_08555 [Dictyocaulus viviparus]|uniref:Uncharacterized protein n=1 Tax=Dictyocaulus viviparus TaxID=29172 RepID=A0A0D8XL81_DICVI|nr:hypothetical protein DICVIV_08555 [Dictyocaulus viviparus]